MRQRIPICLAAIAIAIVLPLLSASSVMAQGNSISGSVFGAGRQAVSDVFVELRDEFSRSLQRVRTNSAGHYAFNGLASGHFKVAVLPYDLPYEEQEQDVEIVNFSRPAGGGSIPSGFASEIVDVYLKVRQGASIGVNGVVFAQDVPARAKELYDRAVTDIEAKRDAEACQELRDALEIFPKYYLALNKLGTEYVRQGHYEAAAILLKMAVDVNSRSYSSWYGLAYAEYSLGRVQDAETAAAKAVEVSPWSTEALVLYGSILRQTGKSKESEQALLKAKDLSKDTLAQVHWELALLYGNGMKRYTDAANELKAFLKLQPDAKDSAKINKLIADFEAKAQHG
jgi:tetratricopeptide (TPR) repeat protein